MIESLILIGAKLLKLAILGMLALVSHVAGSGCCGVEATASVDSTAAFPAQATAEATVVVAVDRDGRLERVGRLVPPVRVEMTFTPDLLVPPRRDPSL